MSMHDWFCSTSYHIKLVSGLYQVQCINLNINKPLQPPATCRDVEWTTPSTSGWPLCKLKLTTCCNKLKSICANKHDSSSTSLYGRRLASILAIFQHKSMIAKYILAGLNLSRLSLTFSLINHRQLCKFFFFIISYIIATENENYKVGLSLVTNLTLHVVIWQKKHKKRANQQLFSILLMIYSMYSKPQGHNLQQPLLYVFSR